MKRILFFPLFFLGSLMYAQPELEHFDDGVYRDHIRSVRMHVNGLFLSLPVASLGANEALYLSFDELDGTGTAYYYTVIHCDRHWKPTEELSQFDYLGGYKEGEIRDYEFSSGTYQDYIHYKLSIPNEEVKWNISGNYLLVVYEQGNENDPILTKRFMITDELVSYRTYVDRPAQVAKQNTHQEIDFTMDIKALKCSNPRFELSSTLMQNGRWDNAIADLEPRTITGTILSFDYQDKIVFEAGKEFRNMDISSMKFRSENVLDIKEFKDGLSTILFEDEPRALKNYLWRRDLNGMYVPFNRDYDRRGIPEDSLASTINLVNRYNYREQHLGTEYTEVLVTLNMPDDVKRDVYVVGGMTDWKMLPEYRMTYDERIDAYTGRLYLKQGYYNYAYAVPNELSKPDLAILEGSWYATENLYTILTYFRPRGGQYDQLVGVHTFNSNY
ncbi:MAG: DUF5103 domain-containing protein [Saprospiraceae bacterium]